MQRNAVGAWVLQGLLAAAFLAANALVVRLRRDQLAWAAQRNENA